MTLSCDFETYSEFDLIKGGAYPYFLHPSTELLMLGWALEDEPVEIWDIAAGEPMPRTLIQTMYDPGILIRAFNANFERLGFRRLGYEIPIERFRCTQVEGYGLSFSGGLDDMAAQFNLGLAKDVEGKALIRRFSKPQAKNTKVKRWTRENDPEGWELFKKYCKQDVEVERALARKLAPYQFPEQEWRYYTIDQRINDRGVPVDVDLIEAAIAIDKENKELILYELQELTGLANPNSNQQMLRWLASMGHSLPDMQKETVEKKLTDPLDDPLVTQVLKLKQQLARTSVSKYQAFKRAVCPDGRVRGMFQFAGASRTRRWAGRVVQLQNLPRGGNVTKSPEQAADNVLSLSYPALKFLYEDCQGLLSDLIRATIKASEGSILNVADLSSIESRVLGWVSGCRWINDVFDKGLDTYRAFASGLYNKLYDEITKKERNICKPPVLGCGYGLGWKGLIKYAEAMSVELTEVEAKRAVEVFRSQCWEVPAFWDWCKESVFFTIRTGQPRLHPSGVSTRLSGEFLMIGLPSGRDIAYHSPQIQLREAPWGDMIEAFTFMGKDRITGKWGRQSASPGFLCENIVQAIARDILCVWLQRAEEAKFSLIGSVHDEAISEETENRIEELNELIRQPIPWAPGLKLDAAGYCAKRYRKD